MTPLLADVNWLQIALPLGGSILLSYGIFQVIVETRRSEAQGLKILESLARVELTDGLTIDRMLVSESQHIRRDAALLVVVPAVTPQLELALAMLKSSGFSITVFVIMNQEEYVRVEAMLASDGIDVFHIERPTDLRELVTGKVYV